MAARYPVSGDARPPPGVTGFAHDADHPVDACRRPVPDDVGHVGDERRDRDGRRGRRHRRDRHPDGDHAVHAGDGGADDHRRQGRRPDRTQARVRDRLRDLRRGLVHDVDRAVAARPDPRLVVPGGCRRGADPAGDRRARGRELRPGGPSAGLRPGDGGRRGGGRRRPGHRWAVHHVPELALRVRGRGPDRPRDPRGRAPDGGRARGRAPEDRRPRRRAVGRRPRFRGLRRPALERVGLGVTQAGRAGAARHLRDVVADPRRRLRALALLHVGIAAGGPR